MTYRVGDEVIVRKPTNPQPIGNLNWDDRLDQYNGKKAKIVEVKNCGGPCCPSYRMENMGYWYYHGSWLQGNDYVDEKSSGDPTIDAILDDDEYELPEDDD